MLKKLSITLLLIGNFIFCADSSQELKIEFENDYWNKLYFDENSTKSFLEQFFNAIHRNTGPGYYLVYSIRVKTSD